ncbi:hypothetical protein [Microlunatus antarcticus]|uniref:Uncharacterized protein n=1 Tax=Microlunatus antarcticus TaxID=53388 RepID=A0A7W5JSF5_9ACTN|nr:hypothetical protein [Microlunatus antarcticus]MBB3325405.1 hypothetical protein [Microlunatus antarcticus]
MTYPTSAPATAALALVESPTQLLDVIELAYASRGDDELAGLRVAVLAPAPGRTRDQLRAVVALARGEGLPVRWHEPRSGGASVARTIRGLLDELGQSRHLVVGDPSSGVLQVLVGLVRPTDVTVVDDGSVTPELVRRWAAGTRLRLFTCRSPEEPGPRSTGVEVRPNTYAWLRQRFPAPDVRDGVDLVAGSFVGSAAPDPGGYLDGVARIVDQQGVTRYLAHRREPEAQLAQIRALGVEVTRPRLPLEIEARRGPVNATVLSLSPTVARTLPLVLADTRVRTSAVLVRPVGVSALVAP